MKFLAYVQLTYIYKIYFLNFYQSHKKNWKKIIFISILFAILTNSNFFEILFTRHLVN